MVVYIANASCHVSLPIRSKHYISNQGLLGQYRLTEHTCSFSSKRPTSYSTDAHICSWKLPSATLRVSSSFDQWAVDFLCRALRQNRGRGNYHWSGFAGQFPVSNFVVTLRFLKSPGNCHLNISNTLDLGRWCPVTVGDMTIYLSSVICPF